MVLDKKTRILIDKLYRFVSNDEYVIVSFGDLVKALPYKCDVECIKENVAFLERLELIKIKYTDELNLCYAMLPKGRISVEVRDSERKQTGRERRRAVRYGFFILILVVAGTIIGNIISQFFGLGG